TILFLRGRGATVTVRQDDAELTFTASVSEPYELTAPVTRIGELDSNGVATFNVYSLDGAAEAIAAELEATDGVNGVVLDLSRAAAGSVAAIDDLVGLFVSDATTHRLRARKPEHTTEGHTETAAYESLPAVVIVSSVTTGAPESVAAALRDHQRALILGGQTAGRGELETRRNVLPDLHVKVRSGELESPLGYRISGNGVAPNSGSGDEEKIADTMELRDQARALVGLADVYREAKSTADWPISGLRYGVERILNEHIDPPALPQILVAGLREVVPHAQVSSRVQQLRVDLGRRSNATTLTGEVARDLRQLDAIVAWLREHDRSVADLSNEEIQERFFRGLIPLLGTYARFAGEHHGNAGTRETTGLGVHFRAIQAGGQVFIDHVQPGSPGAHGGVPHNSELLTINGTSVSELTLAGITTALSTESATLTVRAEPGIENSEVTEHQLEWAPFEPKTIVVTEPVADDGSATIRITEFARGPAREFHEQVEALQAQGMKKLILDLRNCHGGYRNEAAAIADLFLGEGTFVAELERDGSTGAHVRTQDQETDLDAEALQLVVVTDVGTASAAELLTAALVERDRAKSYGTLSFGKWIQQDSETLHFGHSLTFTTHELQSPSGARHHGAGLTPTVCAREQDGVCIRAALVGTTPLQDARSLFE
ncbi:MAG: S41 family peptidase, partial [Myxococcota bacterium]